MRTQTQIETFPVPSRVFGIDGPGQWPREGLCARMGVLTGYEQTEWGYMALVQWDTKSKPDRYSAHTLMRADSGRQQIGVYVAC